MTKMNEKGFTIIELIAVIGVLALIIGLAIPSILSVKDNINEKTYQTKIEMIKKSSKLYIEDNVGSITHDINETLNIKKCTEEIPLENGMGCKYDQVTQEYQYVYVVTVEELVNEGIYKKENNDKGCLVVNPKDNTCMDNEEVTFYISNRKVTSGYGGELSSPESLNAQVKVENTSSTSNSITVTIKTSGADKDTLTEYYYSIQGNNYEKSNSKTHTFTNLAPGIKYEIKVYAKNRDGERTSTAVGTAWTEGLSFSFTIPEYQRIKLENVPKGFKVKYAEGNQNKTHFETNGTDITSSLTINASDNKPYTVALINNDGKVMSIKKIYIYNNDDSAESLDVAINDNSITKIIGEPKTNNGTASVKLNNQNIMLEVSGGDYYGETEECTDGYYYCPNGGDVNDWWCEGSTYEITTDDYIGVDCATGKRVEYSCTGNCNQSCSEGYTHSDWEETIEVTQSCSEGDIQYSERHFTAECIWDGDYWADWECTDYDWFYYYQYTIGFEFE